MRNLLLIWLVLGLSHLTEAQTKIDTQSSFNYFLQKTDLDRKDFVAEYLYEINNDTYDKYKDDEFEFNSVINNQYNQIVDEISKLDNSYYIVTSGDFGNYNFDLRAFEYTDLTNETYFSMKNSPNSYYCKQCKTFTDIDLYFTNSTEVSQIPVNESSANSMIKNRKKSSGNVDRGVFLKIYFDINEQIQIETKDENRYDVKIIGTITKVEFLDVYGFNNKSGSQRVFSTLNLGSIKAANEPKTLSNDPELEKVKSYIKNSLIEQNLKDKLVDVIESNQ